MSEGTIYEVRDFLPGKAAATNINVKVYEDGKLVAQASDPSYAQIMY